MRSKEQFINAYAESHQNPVNQISHFICVTVIVFCSLGILWCVPVGQWLGLPANIAPWVNMATIGGVLSGIFYARLGLKTLLAMTVWFGISIAGIYAMQSAGLPVLWISIAVWIAAWIGQFYGHKVEGAKPSFADDLVFLLIGPLFVMHEIKHRGDIQKV